MTRADFIELLDGRTLVLQDESEFVLQSVHQEALCAHRECVIHNPTDHHMADWPLIWREDRRLFERLCECGIGHPDPDQFAYWAESGQESIGVHGCDGCCVAGSDE